MVEVTLMPFALPKLKSVPTLKLVEVTLVPEAVVNFKAPFKPKFPDTFKD